MSEVRTQTALPAAKLRSLPHYCPDLANTDPIFERLGKTLADLIEKHDATITPIEFRKYMEVALRQQDPEDYDARSRGQFILIVRLSILETLLDSVLPRPFAEAVRDTYA